MMPGTRLFTLKFSEADAPPVTIPSIARNEFFLYFHQHNGKDDLNCLFSSTSWQGHKLTFFLHLFSTT